MNRKEFEKKYKTEIALMAREKDVDMGVAYGMFVAHVKERIAAENNFKYNFVGARNLNLTELDKDIAAMEGRAAELRKQTGF